MGLSRRMFTKECKLAAVQRLEQGVSLGEVANGGISTRLLPFPTRSVLLGRRTCPQVRYGTNQEKHHPAFEQVTLR